MAEIENFKHPLGRFGDTPLHETSESSIEPPIIGVLSSKKRGNRRIS